MSNTKKRFARILISDIQTTTIEIPSTGIFPQLLIESLADFLGTCKMTFKEQNYEDSEKGVFRVRIHKIEKALAERIVSYINDNSF